MLAQGAMAAALAAGTMSALVHAQVQTPAESILVVGRREILGIAPERSLNAEDVSGYGLSTVGEVLDEIAAEAGETREEPVFLISGRRVSSLADVEDLPAEAIASVSVLPRGSGTRVGASATRRVYNIELHRQLDTAVARATVRGATDGGWTAYQGNVSYTRLRGARRVNLAVRIRGEDGLLESERDVQQPAGSVPEIGRYRSLRPSLGGIDVSFSGADRLASWLTGSISGKLSSRRQSSQLGLIALVPPGGARAQERRTRALEGNFDLALNADAGSWLVTFLGTYQHQHRKTFTEVPGPEVALGVGEARTDTTTRAWNAQFVATGPVFELPAGQARLTLGGGFSRDSLSGDRSSAGILTRSDYAQSSQSLSGAIEVPLASRSRGFLPFLGDLTASIELMRMHVSNAGWFTNHTYSLFWQPVSAIRLHGYLTDGISPPAAALIAEPLLETPGARYFDPLQGETVDVTEITGGTAGLAPQRALTKRFSLTVTPSAALQFTAEYRAIRNRDIITALPQASEAILLAFPERFIRDPQGRLTAVDVRPVTFARQEQQQLHFGINLSLPLDRSGTNNPSAATDASDDKPEGNTRGGGSRPRLQFHSNYTKLLKSELVIVSGQRPLDLLSRDALALAGAASPKDQFDVTLGYAERGLGVRLSSQMRGASYLSLASGTATDTLTFAPLTTFNLRAFAEGRRLFPKAGWAKGSRFTVSAVNLTNRRERVVYRSGQTPVSYQAIYRNPVGRTIEVEFRKVF